MNTKNMNITHTIITNMNTKIATVKTVIAKKINMDTNTITNIVITITSIATMTMAKQKNMALAHLYTLEENLLTALNLKIGQTKIMAEKSLEQKAWFILTQTTKCLIFTNKQANKRC